MNLENVCSLFQTPFHKQYEENGNFCHKVGESEFLAKSFKPFLDRCCKPSRWLSSFNSIIYYSKRVSFSHFLILNNKL